MALSKLACLAARSLAVRFWSSSGEYFLGLPLAIFPRTWAALHLGFSRVVRQSVMNGL